MTKQIYKFDPDQVWFTSDTHFGHENIIRFCGRPLSSIWVISPMADRVFGMT